MQSTYRNPVFNVTLHKSAKVRKVCAAGPQLYLLIYHSRAILPMLSREFTPDPRHEMDFSGLATFFQVHSREMPCKMRHPNRRPTLVMVADRKL
jgi:hypothetical protein